PWRDTGIVDRCAKSTYARVGDFDGDGRAELFTTPAPTTTMSAAQRVVEMDDLGSFSSRPTNLCFASTAWDCTGLERVAAAASVGDFNGDGIHDLALERFEGSAA